MRRELLVVLVVIVVAALVLTVGFYLLYLSLRPPPTPPPQGAQTWRAQLVPGLTYGTPVYGPTTPLNDAVGGMWVINAAREGVIEMNLSAMAVGISEDPFATGNISFRLNVAADFGESGTPLGPVYYIVPAKDWAVNGSTGPSRLNGALAFFAGSDFVAADPFNHSVFFRDSLPFVPTWTGQDPASAGNMLIAPAQRVVAIGLLSYPVGPYTYFWASDGNHTAVFEVSYVHAGYCPCAAPSGRQVLLANATLTAPPFVYYNQFQVNSTTSYRSGPGAAILLPLANHTLEVLDTQPRVRAWLPLTLAGQPASVAGDMGFVQTSWPLDLLVPVRSSASTGFVALNLGDLTESFEYVAGPASWVPVGAPVSRSGITVYTAWYDPGGNETHFAAVNGTSGVIPQSLVSVAGRASSRFYVMEASKTFMEMPTGEVVTLNTPSVISSNVTATPFALDLPASHPEVLYAGSPGGTRYGTLLASLELRGGWTDSSTATTALFRLVPLVTVPASRAASLESMGLLVSASAATVPVLAVAVLTGGRRTSCSARASGPRWSCPRRCA